MSEKHGKYKIPKNLVIGLSIAALAFTFSTTITGNVGATSSILVRVDDGATLTNIEKDNPSDNTIPKAKTKSQTSKQPPDIIIILTDDQRAGTERAMPYSWNFFQEQNGVWYPNTQVPTNLCCPARAAFLTGKYAHETNVWDNAGKYGGYKPLHFVEDDTLPVWLKQVGYKTGLFGKLVNRFPGKKVPVGYVPPGWDDFYVYEGPKGASYYSNVRGLGAGKYTTNTLGKQTTRFIKNTNKDQPLFALYSPFAPHSPYNAGPYKNSTTPEQLAQMKEYGYYKNDSYNTVSPKQPWWMQQLNPLSKDNSSKTTDQIVKEQSDALNGVDHNVERIVNTISKYRNLDNTLFVYMGDNGYAWGDHRFVGKRHPHNTVNEVPLMIRYPQNINPPTLGTDDRLSNNIDVNKTIALLAGASTDTSQGNNLLSEDNRDYLPLEAAATQFNGPYTQKRPAYCGVRTKSFSYIEYSTQEIELYDLEKDPYQINNLGADPEYQTQLDKLRKMSENTGCDLEKLVEKIEPKLPVRGEE